MSRREGKQLTRLIIAFALFLILTVVDKTLGLAQYAGGKFGWLLPFFLYLAVYIFIGYDVLWRAARGVVRGSVLDENFLMCAATLGAFALGVYTGVTSGVPEGFDEGCAVLIFYQAGEFFQGYATEKSRKSVSSLMDIRPDYANVKRNGEIMKVVPEEVKIGETLVIYPGEKIPLDGTVIKGASALDVRALTGESLPAETGEGCAVLSGAVNISSQIEVRAEKEFYDSAASKILDLVENAAGRKSKAENFISRFARFYTPAVVGVALVLGVIPPLFNGEWTVWLYRALSFLVVSCPCALVISVPLSFFAGIGAASRYGILVKGSNYLESISRANIFVFDKTGTLTEGNFDVTEIVPQNRADEILRLAAIAEKGSAHPIARSIISRYGAETEEGFALTNYAGKGVCAEKDGDVILCGNEKLMKEHGVSYVVNGGAGTAVYVAKNGEFIGSLLISDQIKVQSAGVINELNACGAKTVMLTGDNAVIAESVAKKLNLTSYSASLLPQDKVEEVEKMLAEKGEKDVLCFIGDGINDAPVLMRSDVGIAMGGVGSDAAIEAADAVILDDDLRGVPLVKKIAKKTMRIVRQNIVFSLAIKIAILALSAAGLANMWLAVFGDVGVSVLAILNAMRVNTRYKGDKKEIFASKTADFPG